jgi:very-short-patch-repair endonuclease
MKQVITTEKIKRNYKLGRVCNNCSKPIHDRGKSGLCFSCCHKGNLNPFYGKHHSEDTKKIMKEKAKFRDKTTYLGFPITPEIIEKRKNTMKINWERLTIEEKHKKLENFIKAGRKTRDTKIELIIKNILDDIGMLENIDYEMHKDINGFNIDFLVHNEFIIECYGDYWHKNPKYYNDDKAVIKRTKDINKKEFLEAKGYIFINFWEEDIHNSIDTIKQQLKIFFKDYFNLFEWESCSCM